MTETPATRRQAPSRDPVLKALDRLLKATDRNIATAAEVRQARIELAELIQTYQEDDQQ